MEWLSPRYSDLRDVVGAARERLVLCSPFVGRAALEAVGSALASDPPAIEVWTRLRLTDWLSGASDVVALGDFVDESLSKTQVAVWQSDFLHSKLILADATAALVGSANLTAGGYAVNMESAVRVSGTDVPNLLPHVDQLRSALAPVSPASFFEFVDQCRHTETTRRAVVELIQEEALQSDLPSRLVHQADFMRALEAGQQTFVRSEIVKIHYDVDGNHRMGHLKQAFYGVQRFLRERPEFVAQVASGSEADQYGIPGAVLEAWIEFFNSHLGETSELYAYSFDTLHHELTHRDGGTRERGGGAGYPFRLVWVPVAKLLNGQL